MTFRMKRPKIFDGYPMEYCEKMQCYVCPLREWHKSRHCPAKVKENGLRRGTHPSHTHSLDLNKEYDRLTGANKIDIPTLVREQRAAIKTGARERAKFTSSPEQLEEAKNATLRIIAYRTPAGEEETIRGYMLDSVDLSPEKAETSQARKRDGFGRFINTGKKAIKKKKLTNHDGLNTVKGAKNKLGVRRSCEESITKKMREEMLEDQSETSTDEVLEPRASLQKRQLKHTRINLIYRDVIEGGTSSSCTSAAASPAHQSPSFPAVHSAIDNILQRPFVLPTTIDEITTEFYSDIRSIPYVKRYLTRSIKRLRENDHRSEAEDNKLNNYEQLLRDIPELPPNLF